MRKPLLFILLSIFSCDQDVKLPYVDVPKEKYYSDEILPEKHRAFYGKWKLISISGGYTSQGMNPDFDFLIIRQFGIFVIVKNDKIVESGKIELESFDIKSNLLQVKFLVDSSKTSEYIRTWPERYVELTEKNELNLVSPGSHAFSHHFERVK